MKIISSKTALVVLSDFRNYFCVVFFLCISIIVPAQIYQANSSTLYISEGASIIEINKNKETHIIKNKAGKIFVSQNTIVYSSDNALSEYIIIVESAKNLLASVPKKKEKKTEKYLKPVKKSEFNFTSAKSESSFLLCSTKRNIAISNTNSHIKAILAKSSHLNYTKTVCKTPVNHFFKNENDNISIVNYFSIRPPPIG